MRYFIPLLLLSKLIFADEALDFEDDFLESLNEVSEIATKTKLNIDDIPSFVTVLQSEKLQRLGVDNVLEALAQVPGVQLKREATGVPVVVFRGITQKGEVKLMVDGVTINNIYRGSIYHYLDFPIELVERIEVIRGAGSVLYGSGAISGVVNVITKSSCEDAKNAVFVSGGTYDNYKGGAIVSTNIADVKISADAYYQNSEKEIASTDRHLTDYSIALNLKSENFSFLTRFKKSEQGEAYGALKVPDTSRDKFDNTNEALISELSYSHFIAKKSKIKVLAGYSHYEQHIEDIHPANIIINTQYKEYSYYGQIDFSSDIITDHELLVGAKLESTEALESNWKWENLNPAPIPYNVEPNSKRNTSSIYINDIFSPTSDNSFTAGFRYDNYSDFGDAFSPTLGAVYKINKNFTFKALYANAFRAPSWVELTSNNELKAETSSSYEAGLIYKKDQSSSFRINAFKTRLNDMITQDAAKKYIQSSYANFTGTELEYIFTPSNQLDLHLFGSYVQAKDQNNDDIVDIANILTTASLMYEANFGLGFGTLFKYKSNHNRSNIILDETITYSFKDITASLIIKDIFNKGSIYHISNHTIEEFDDGGRTIFLKAAWEF